MREAAPKTRPSITATAAAGAHISPCGAYRYRLWRTWDPSLPRILWVMLNPSTADALKDDPTLRRCIGYSMAWEYGGLDVVNLFALRSSDPNALLCDVPAFSVGPDNDRHIANAEFETSQTILAWGSHRAVAFRKADVLHILNPYRCTVLGRNKDGQPKHPLYCRKDLTPVPYITL